MLQQFLLATLLSVALAFPDPQGRTTSQQSANQATVTTPQGDILGSILTSRLGKPIYSFRGVRYAKAPVEELRFQPPVPIEKWNSTYNATEDGPMCPQPNEESTSEDCLLLNVYTTKLPKGNDNPKRPVIVYFHPGGWYKGSGVSSEFGPQYLLDQDIVLVVPNYRLGTLGFLSTGDEQAPGNNGFKDQVLALKWVKSNIKSFGGNPTSVTIMGSGAGGASVTLHLVSPMSKGLFHKAIAMSGSIFGNWPIPHDHMDLAKKQAKLVGCPDDSSENIIKCLKNKDAKELADTLDGFKEFGKDPAIIWTPVIEKDFGQNRFLVESPFETIQSDRFDNKIPVIMGVTTDEYAHLAFNVIGNDSLLEKMNAEFEKVAPISFIYERDTEKSKKASKELKKFYFEDKKIDNSTLAHLGQIYADGIIGFGVYRGAKMLQEKANMPVYFYKFDYKGRYSNFYLPDSNNTAPYGVVHRDDLIYLFPCKTYGQFKDNDQDIATVEKMTIMWASFAKTGNPIQESSEKLDGAKWDNYSTKKEYLNIGNKLVMEHELFDKRYNEWDSLFVIDKTGSKSKHG